MAFDFDDDDQEPIRQTVVSEVKTGVEPEVVYRRVQQRHPKASNQEIVHAAFRSMIDCAMTADHTLAERLHRFAFEARTF